VFFFYLRTFYISNTIDETEEPRLSKKPPNDDLTSNSSPVLPPAAYKTRIHRRNYLVLPTVAFNMRINGCNITVWPPATYKIRFHNYGSAVLPAEANP